MSIDDKIQSLIKQLTDPDKHHQAKDSLAEIGKAAVPQLLESLKDSDYQMRLESARALERIADVSAAPALVEAMDDDRAEVRWRAAEAMISIGEPGLPILLKALSQQNTSVHFYEQALHVLRRLSDESDIEGILNPVIAALRGSQPALTVPLAAHTALNSL